MYISATLCIGACTALASCSHSRPHSFLQRRRARPARKCRMWELIHWGWVMHICISNLTIIGSDYGLSPSRHQAIIWTSAGILTGPLGTNFSEILIEIYICLFKKMHLKTSSANRRPCCLVLNMLMAKDMDKWSHPYKTIAYTCNPSPIHYLNVKRGRLLRHRWVVIAGVTIVVPYHVVEFLMMTPSNGNIFRVTGPLRVDSTGQRWISLTKASDTELWFFLWSTPKQTVQQAIETLVIWDAISLIMTSLYSHLKIGSPILERVAVFT